MLIFSVDADMLINADTFIYDNRQCVYQRDRCCVSHCCCVMSVHMLPMLCHDSCAIGVVVTILRFDIVFDCRSHHFGLRYKFRTELTIVRLDAPRCLLLLPDSDEINDDNDDDTRDAVRRVETLQ